MTKEPMLPQITNPLPNYNNPNNNNNQGFGQNPLLQRSMTQRQKNVITTKILKDAFRNYCIDNDYLNRPRFNVAIESIFRFNIPSMHYTYLSDKIYDLLDSSGDGKIQEDEFLEGFSAVLKDKNYRLLLSMMAMMSLPDKSRDYIEISEIKEFFLIVMSKLIGIWDSWFRKKRLNIEGIIYRWLL